MHYIKYSSQIKFVILAVSNGTARIGVVWELSPTTPFPPEEREQFCLCGTSLCYAIHNDTETQRHGGEQTVVNLHSSDCVCPVESFHVAPSLLRL